MDNSRSSIYRVYRAKPRLAEPKLCFLFSCSNVIIPKKSRTLFAHQTILTTLVAHFSHTKFRMIPKKQVCIVCCNCLFDKYLRKLNKIIQTAQAVFFIDFGSEGLGFESLWVYLMQALCKFKTYKGFCVYFLRQTYYN